MERFSPFLLPDAEPVWPDRSTGQFVPVQSAGSQPQLQQEERQTAAVSTSSASTPVTTVTAAPPPPADRKQAEAAEVVDAKEGEKAEAEAAAASAVDAEEEAMRRVQEAGERGGCPLCRELDAEPDSEGWAERVASHMAHAHGFFVPDAEYLVDLPGLVRHLRRKVRGACVCLYCLRQFGSQEAVQNHMRDLSHAKLAYDHRDLYEYLEFYDFSADYPPEEDEDEDEVVGQKDEAEEEEKKGAVGSSGTTAEQQSAEEQAQERARRHEERAMALLDERARKNVEVVHGGYALRLNASGKEVGHRSLRIYYRQRLRPSEPANPARLATLQHLLGEYRLLGWKGNQGRPRAVEELRLRPKAEERRYQKMLLEVGMKGNNQAHWRDPTRLF